MSLLFQGVSLVVGFRGQGSSNDFLLFILQSVLFNHTLNKFLSQGLGWLYPQIFPPEPWQEVGWPKLLFLPRETLRVWEIVTWDNLQELVLNNPARKKVVRKKDWITLQPNGKIRENQGEKNWRKLKINKTLLTTVKGRREHSAPQFLVSNFSLFSNRLNNFTFFSCVCLCALVPLAGRWDLLEGKPWAFKYDTTCQGCHNM